MSLTVPGVLSYTHPVYPAVYISGITERSPHLRTLVPLKKVKEACGCVDKALGLRF